MLCLCRLWVVVVVVVVVDVPDVFVVTSFYIVTSLAYIREVTCFSFQLENTRFAVWWGSSSVCFFDWACECVCASESYLDACLFE